MKKLIVYLLLFIFFFFTACADNDKKEETSEPITFYHLCKDVFGRTMTEACVYSADDLDQLCGSLSKTRCPNPDDGDYECMYRLHLYEKYVTDCQETLDRDHQNYPFTIPDNYSCNLVDNPQPLATTQEVIDEIKKIDACAWIFDTANHD